MVAFGQKRLYSIIEPCQSLLIGRHHCAHSDCVSDLHVMKFKEGFQYEISRCFGSRSELQPQKLRLFFIRCSKNGDAEVQRVERVRLPKQVTLLSAYVPWIL